MAKWPSPWNEKLILATMHLSPYEMGALARMLMHMCGSPERTLPNDDIYLARITGTGRMWKAIKPVLMPFWTVTPENRLRCALLSATSSSSDALKSKASRIHSDSILTSKRAHSGRPGRVDPMAGDIQKAFEAWNEVARRHGLSVADKINEARRVKLRMRLKEHGLDGWHRALEKVEASAFLRGETYSERFPGWKGAYLDWLLQDSSFLKLMEGKYDDKRPNGRPAAPYRNGFYGGGPSVGDFFEPALDRGTASQAGDASPHSRSEIIVEAGGSGDHAGG